MRYPLLKLLMLTSILSVSTVVSAQANNSRVEEALKNRPDLSVFYQGLINTGVINELKENTSYTVFAPTNAAFDKLPPDKYPCFYSTTCQHQAAEILRNHIVPGEKHLSDLGTHPGGIMSLFAIDDEHIIASEPFKDQYEINGRKVISESQLLGGVLYRIDGVLATPRDMVQFTAPETIMVYSQGTSLPPRTPAGVIVTHTTETVIPADAAPAR